MPEINVSATRLGLSEGLIALLCKSCVYSKTTEELPAGYLINKKKTNLLSKVEDLN